MYKVPAGSTKDKINSFSNLYDTTGTTGNFFFCAWVMKKDN